MKQLYFGVSLCILLLISFQVSAQNNFTINGKVTDTNNAPLKGATVFISGSELITACDDEGRFKFTQLDAGNYHIIVTMVGFTPFSQALVIQNKSEDISIKLNVKEIELAQVNIGGKDHWDSYFKAFKQLFLGKSKNGKACVIMNPRIINFSTKKGILFADANDFLIIENPRLGYRVKYLLKSFGYDSSSGITLYTGDASFEPMQGSPRMQGEWNKNRFEAYQGSLMHFLRSVYQNRVLKEGFIINPIIDRWAPGSVIYYDARPLRFDTLVRAIDTSFVALKFNKVMYTYNPKKAASVKTNSAYPIQKQKTVDGGVTTIKLYTPEAVIDHRGAHRDFRDFLIDGKLARNRVGDQLPYEYEPPANN
jgi:hypothetical protein